jgi:hypothetical protein
VAGEGSDGDVAREGSGDLDGSAAGKVPAVLSGKLGKATSSSSKKGNKSNKVKKAKKTKDSSSKKGKKSKGKGYRSGSFATIAVNGGKGYRSGSSATISAKGGKGGPSVAGYKVDAGTTNSAVAAHSRISLAGVASVVVFAVAGALFAMKRGAGESEVAEPTEASPMLV